MKTPPPTPLIDKHCPHIKGAWNMEDWTALLFSLPSDLIDEIWLENAELNKWLCGKLPMTATVAEVNALIAS